MTCNLRHFAILLAAALAATFGSGRAALAAPPAVAESAAESASGALTAGLQLEKEGLWGDAIRHYEAALRSWEDDPLLTQRLLICRLHYDVRRRYEDTSFREAVRRLPTQQALDLYAEVLANIETHYVDTPDWSRLLLHGTASLEVALSEEPFRKMQLEDVPADQIEEFRQTVHRYVLDRPAETRFDLRANAAYVAGLARQQLGLSGTATVMEFVCGAIGTLDPYSRFLTGNQLDETFSNIEGNFVGLGVELKAEPDRLRIVNVIAEGPAEAAGVVAGDAIVEVDGSRTDASDPDYVADLLRGPEGSYVQLVIVDAEGQRRDMQVQRRRVEVPCVENIHIADAATGTGYFRLTNFQKTTTRDVERALWSLHRQGMRQLIVDVRGNPGGLLSAAVEVADRFINNGRIVTTRGRNVRENFDYLAHATNTWNVPLIVLIDGDSASASEIFAAAIRDQERGQLIGVRTYGKGSVQGIFRMQSAHAGLCLTTAKFFSPKNVAISDRGVSPHIAVEPTYIAARPTNDGRLATVEDDAIFKAAIGHARDAARVSRRP